MVASLLLYERAVQGRASMWPPAVLAGLASWLHPWQGAVLALIVALSEIVVQTQPALERQGRRRHGLARSAPLLVAVALPLAYYALLDCTDSAWRLAEGSLAGAVPPWRVLLMLTPLLAPALLAYRFGGRRRRPTARSRCSQCSPSPSP
jgi:hypothetical protein